VGVRINLSWVSVLSLHVASEQHFFLNAVTLMRSQVEGRYCHNWPKGIHR
jgi:hypothetical protein